MTRARRRNGLRSALLRFILMVTVLVAAFFLFRDSALAELPQLLPFNAGIAPR